MVKLLRRVDMKLLLLGFVLLWTLMVMGPSLDYGWVVALKLSLGLIAWTVVMEFFSGKKWKE
jgi:hypothetical protein|tara:strand:- start:290 stop:475 length:186 start_codon:yes stop_codon:yes gene_type:complete